jgi:hypothetical protein
MEDFQIKIETIITLKIDTMEVSKNISSNIPDLDINQINLIKDFILKYSKQSEKETLFIHNSVNKLLVK